MSPRTASDEAGGTADGTAAQELRAELAAEICAAPDVNQPGGEFYPSTHPNIAGREREQRALADSVRRLIMATSSISATPEQTAAFAAELAEVADRLETHITGDFNRYDTMRPTTAAQQPTDGSGAPAASSEAATAAEPDAEPQLPADPRDLFQYDCILGPYNPLALPLRSRWEDPMAYCYGEFPDAYEGPPGCVHGGVLAAAFDQVFNIANLMSGAAGPTGRLTLHYHKPTPLNTPITFEAQVISRAGSKIITKGRARCGDVVTVRADGLFVSVSREKMAQLRAQVASQ